MKPKRRSPRSPTQLPLPTFLGYPAVIVLTGIAFLFVAAAFLPQGRPLEES
jgi:hypothetical protein